MAVIRWTLEAVRWMEEIYRYIATDNPEAASRVVQAIYDKVQLLCEFPEIGYIYRRHERGDIRILLYGHYRIAYQIGSGSVEILGIFHSGLDLDRLL